MNNFNQLFAPCSHCRYRKRRRMNQTSRRIFRQSITRADAVKTTIKGRTRRSKVCQFLLLAGGWWLWRLSYLLSSIVWPFDNQCYSGVRTSPSAISRSNSFLDGSRRALLLFSTSGDVKYTILFKCGEPKKKNSKWEVVNKSRNIQSIAARVLNQTVILSLLLRPVILLFFSRMCYYRQRVYMYIVL